MAIENFRNYLDEIKDNDNKNKLLGEFLRENVFSGSGFGCYSTFNVKLDFKYVSLEEMTIKYPLIIEAIKQEGWFYEESKWSSMPQCYLSLDDTIAMVYAWTNDGYLSFSWDNEVIFNNDCKKIRWNKYK